MNSKKKVLVIAYYWPPSGGAGVQRWLKLTKYLAKLGHEVHVLSVAPEKASYFHVDESLKNDIHPNVNVHLTSSFEPINIYSRLVGKKNVPTAGYSNVDEQHWKQKLVSGIRSNIFIPDPRVGWKNYAYKNALEIIKTENIQNVITTSPPHSTQLIGLKLKRKLKDKIKWIVDFRDPWTDIYYYPLLQHSKFSHNINLKLERQVIEESDRIITVGEGFKASFLSKTKKVTPAKFEIVSNAFDPDDFKMKDEVHPDKDVFLASYIGTVSDKYAPDIFFEALGQLAKDFPNAPIRFKATGVVSERLQELITDYLGDKASFHDPVPHELAVHAMLKSRLLLLITPGIEGTIPGKTFEYLASGRRIISIGKGDSAKAIIQCEAGAAFERSEKEVLYEYLKEALMEYQNNVHFETNYEELKKMSWDYKAAQVAQLLE
ncbi:glycosyltransferase family protein [Brumimicrobium mesophilum]|uniref:glycosyltransferase n=1 Tax=Brumimicrobium mesophilum TaxID=392717 RepID=UPI000D1407F5|nr:glycosyltransferase [Brumimicrobium mesophilum]